MGDVTQPSLSLADVQGMFDQQLTVALAGVIKVTGPYTVDTLPTPNAALVGTFARVTDLFGEKTDNVLCSAYGGNYFWQPVRPFWARTANAAQLAAIQAGTFQYVPLKTPSLMRIPSSFSLTGNGKVSLSTAGAWPGAMYQLAMDGALGLNTLTISGLDAGALLSVVAGGRPEVYYDGAAYQKF